MKRNILQPSTNYFTDGCFFAIFFRIRQNMKRFNGLIYKLASFK